MYLSYTDGDNNTYKPELDVTLDGDIATYTLFKFKYSTDYDLLYKIYNQTNNSEVVYNVYLFVKDASDVTIYIDNILPQITLINPRIASGSDGYIANSSIYLNTYENNTITRFSDTLFSSTNSVGGLNGFNYYSGPDYENGDYLLSIEGGTDIATTLENVFIMYKPLTNAQEFKVTYLTTLQAYYIAYENYTLEQATTKVLELFQLDGYSNIDIDLYDPIYELIQESAGSDAAYKENCYLSILISECINAGKSQNDVMTSIINNEVNIQPVLSTIARMFRQQ